MMFDLYANEAESVEFVVQVRGFMDLAFDEDSPFTEPDAKRQAIRDEARAFVARGGLQLPL